MVATATVAMGVTSCARIHNISMIHSTVAMAIHCLRCRTLHGSRGLSPGVRVPHPRPPPCSRRGLRQELGLLVEGPRCGSRLRVLCHCITSTRLTHLCKAKSAPPPSSTLPDWSECRGGPSGAAPPTRRWG